MAHKRLEIAGRREKLLAKGVGVLYNEHAKGLANIKYPGRNATARETWRTTYERCSQRG